MRLLLGLVPILLLLAAPARAQRVDPGDLAITDVLQVVVDGRRLLAFDARTGGARETTLDLGESVSWTGARGLVGIVLTDRRLLAVCTRSASWQEKRWRRAEQPPASVVLGARAAVAASDQRVFGFDGGSGRIVEKDLGVRERVLAVDAGDDVGVVVTDRRALAVSAAAGGFFVTPLRLDEQLVDVSVLANIATLTFADRLLVFRAPTRTWEERDR